MPKNKEEPKEKTANQEPSPAPELQEFSYELKIPEERIAVLIGEQGKTKKEIESETKTQINVTKEGEVTITGNDALLLFTAREIVRAIARGFNPDLALLLLKTNYALEIIDLKDFAGKSKKTQLRLKGRIIGREGKSRREIERLTNTHISVYGKTVALLGETMDLTTAHQAIQMLLQGSKHRTVFSFLEKRKKEALING